MDNKFIINISGKDFIKFEGLLSLFHENGGESIKTEIVSTNPLIIQATASGTKGVYQGIGDANKDNVSKMIAQHSIRMAETRAIARALRWYNNIGMCSSDELGGGDKPAQSAAPVVQVNNQGEHMELSAINCSKCGGPTEAFTGINTKVTPNKPWKKHTCNNPACKTNGKASVTWDNNYTG